jgi:hypothetical protein
MAELAVGRDNGWRPFVVVVGGLEGDDCPTSHEY